MENVEELHRQAEEVKQRLKRDILALNDIVKKAVDTCSEMGKFEAEDAVLKAERRLEETVSDFQNQFEKAFVTATGSITNTNRILTRTLNFTDFANIEIDCAFHAEIARCTTYEVTIRASEFLINYLDVIKSGNTLKLSLKPHRFYVRPALEVKIAMPALSKLRLGATSRCTVHGFNSKENLQLRLTGSSILETDIVAGQTTCEISGASRLKGKMQIADAEFTLSGASRMELEGSAKNVVLNAWGASEANMEEFAANDMSVHLNAASEAVINASGKLDVDLSSGSRLTYMDSPKIRAVSVTGASSLNHR